MVQANEEGKVQITSEEEKELLKLWFLSDEHLFNKVKRYLLIELVTSPTLFIDPKKRVFLRLAISLIFSSKKSAIQLIKKYLEEAEGSFHQKICIDLNYCENKRKFTKYFDKAQKLKDIITFIYPGDVPAFLIFLNSIKNVCIAGVHVHILPLPLAFFITKEVLDSLCHCK
jgi:hypothetical protein